MVKSDPEAAKSSRDHKDVAAIYASMQTYVKAIKNSG